MALPQGSTASTPAGASVASASPLKTPTSLATSYGGPRCTNTRSALGGVYANHTVLRPFVSTDSSGSRVARPTVNRVAAGTADGRRAACAKSSFAGGAVEGPSD